MKNRASVIRLVERAQRGDREGLNRLAGAVKPRLYEYVVRMTLDEQLAEDVVQESLLTMVQSIETLRESGQYWPWLVRIATNKIRSHHRRNGRRSRLLSTGSPPSPDGVQDAVVEVISKEIRQIVLSAMQRLPLEHRLILNMRCYEELSFTEIAEALDCRTFTARALFAKAKRRLGRNLAQSGLGKASLLGALIIYGKMTATSEATGMATVVSAASLKAGLLPTLAAATTARAALVAVATVGVSAAATSMVIAPPGGTTPAASNSPAIGSPLGPEHARTDREQWYYYPPDSDGAVLIQVRNPVDGRRPGWQWFQNEEGNFSCSGRTVYRVNANYRAHDLRTMRLPTDSAALSAFLDEVESCATATEYVRPTQKGLLVVTGANNNGPFTQVRRGYDITDEQAFRNPWQHDTRIIDRRDALHKEGWAYFRLSGQIRGRTITGTGCIPFVLAKRQVAPPWLRVAVEDSVVLEDHPGAAVICDGSGRIRQRFAGGTFLEGLSRPWEGLHTVDTVRRDAARYRLWFETGTVTEDRQISVAVTRKNMRLVYTIDLDRDMVREIALHKGQSEIGRLRLEYVKDLGEKADTINEAGSTRRRLPRQRRGETLWLFSLMEPAWD